MLVDVVDIDEAVDEIVLYTNMSWREMAVEYNESMTRMRHDSLLGLMPKRRATG